ncbi:MAG: preprotein translocase subunit YidC [Candidatus Phytoplasma pruni]|uniref:YidC/Oxa1 family membrane protein insertase n=1 Tax=Poinsettia branch-inducing phytoplasma TaxID=138647 RepID=UPI0003644131|nr:membrane protein insertase YidC [Poinsettia branch-inducing phytoplasma]WEK82571.1 MAG: preprotein translocase subunit YidC [Candidatus Phytoplasma pruni]
MSKKKLPFKQIQKILIFLSITILLFIFFQWAFPSKKNIEELKDADIKIVFNHDVIVADQTKKTLKGMKEKLNDPESFSFTDYSNYVNIFQIGIQNNKNIVVRQWNKEDFNPPEKNENSRKIIDAFKKTLKDKIDAILLNKTDYFFSFEKELDEKKNPPANVVKQFFTIKRGTNFDYALGQNDYDKVNKQKLLVYKIDSDESVKIVTNFEIFKDKEKTEKIHADDYNKAIREKKDDNGVFNYFVLKEDAKQKDLNLKLFVDDSGDSPIQWPSKLRWTGILGWGYIWNVLIIFIGSSLDFFSNVFAGKEDGIFFGNLGLGIVLTTILIRTLSWPIYTKTSSFSLNMSLAQPEIDKIRAKYVLRKDKTSMQQMQMEIMKVYKKYNFNIFGIFITFLQMPIFIAMLRSLNRFRVYGGMFIPRTGKHFLGFINLNPVEADLIVKLVLSLFVGISMFFLNKLSLKKPSYLKQNTKILTLEQQTQKKAQEKSMKVFSYMMIGLMTFASFKDVTLSLYWVVGNLFTIVQTIINHKLMENKYILLKKQGL